MINGLSPSTLPEGIWDLVPVGFTSYYFFLAVSFKVFFPFMLTIQALSLFSRKAETSMLSAVTSCMN